MTMMLLPLLLLQLLLLLRLPAMQPSSLWLLLHRHLSRIWRIVTRKTGCLPEQLGGLPKDKQNAYHVVAEISNAQSDLLLPSNLGFVVAGTDAIL